MKSDSAGTIGIQLVDGSGQTHQRKGTPIILDGHWHDLVIEPSTVAGGEHWGGANDGKWHGPPAQIAISLTAQSDAKAKRPVLHLAEIRAEALRPVFVQPAAFKGDFENMAQSGSAWTVLGDVRIDTKSAFKGSGSLALARTLEDVERPCSVVGPIFAVVPGQWEIRVATKAALHSPDNSYNAVVQIECIDGAGKIMEATTVADVFRDSDWQAASKRIEVPKGAVSARVRAQLNKTYGRFWMDELSVSYLAPSPRKDDRIVRLLFSTAQLGNLLFPNDSRRIGITVEAHKPLRDNQRTIACVVRDYWGAEQMRPASVELGGSVEKEGRFNYDAALDLGDVPLEVGRYYELHAEIPQEGEEPFRNHTSFAILPEAETKRFKPEEIPFTSRNWDNRISEYIKLSDRLGVRVCGLWGGWSEKPPYRAEVPGLELCQQLGMGWLTNTPIAGIERGERKYDEQALRQGVRSLIGQFGRVRPMVINLGNEPHGSGERVRENVAAYRAVYEEVKTVDPSIAVVATSVEPNEEYFQLGYGKWCDAYDFHIYESAADVRSNIGKYRELMAKYGVMKPIWSTELGLNSQGQTRHAVAVELIKKFATFFAAGGTNMSWFGLLYPDPDAKDHGGSGDSHNVFDCRYNRYCPRLDAVAYYNGVNSIAAKKFTDEKIYADGINVILFRDSEQRSLQVVWKDKGRQDVSIPLAGVGQVQIIRMDGSRRVVGAGQKSATLSITEDPLLLIYEGGPNALPPVLDPPAATLHAPPQTVSRRDRTTVSVVLTGTAADADLVAPPFWMVKKSALAERDGNKVVEFTFTPPAASAVREADLVVTLSDSKGTRCGELYLRCPVGE